MIRLLLWLIGLPDTPGKSGKRETAALVTLFTAVLLCVSWPYMSTDQWQSILTWLLSLSALLLMLAFGFDAYVKQAGFNLGNSKIETEKPPQPIAPDPAPPPNWTYDGTPSDGKVYSTSGSS